MQPCACAKVPHPNEALAQRHADALRAKQHAKRARRLVVYPCPDVAGRWHVGHRPRKRHDPRH